jgi:hypothetical protein
MTVEKLLESALVLLLLLDVPPLAVVGLEKNKRPAFPVAPGMARLNALACVFAAFEAADTEKLNCTATRSPICIAR